MKEFEQFKEMAQKEKEDLTEKWDKADFHANLLGQRLGNAQKAATLLEVKLADGEQKMIQMRAELLMASQKNEKLAAALEDAKQKHAILQSENARFFSSSTKMEGVLDDLQVKLNQLHHKLSGN